MIVKNKISYTVFALLFFTIACKGVQEDKAKEKVTSLQEMPTEDYLFSTLISKNGTILFEKYANGKTKDSVADVQSLTKGIMSILIGIAIDKGYLKDIHEPIQKYFPEEFQMVTDTRKEAITIAHLLNQTSGLAWNGYLEHQKWLDTDDPISFVLQKKLDYPPGQHYNYNSGATHLLSVILSRVYGDSTLAFANTFLFKDLQITSIEWQKRNKGYYDGSGLGLRMKPMDLMKTGQLLEKNGRWNGKQIVSKKWVEKLLDKNEKSATKWGLPNSTHGFCWYKANYKGYTIDYGMGYGGQFILLIPEISLIIVTTHNHDTPNGIAQQIAFLNTKLPKIIEKYED